MPTDPKALKTYQNAIDWLKSVSAVKRLIPFEKPPGRTLIAPNVCARLIRWPPASGNIEEAEEIAREWLTIASTDVERAATHYRIAIALQQQGINDKKEKCFDESSGEFKTALQLEPKFTTIHCAMGVSLAHMHQDNAARAEFSNFLATDTVTPDVHERAQRYIDRVNLARARMAPPFSITTTDGKQISLDSLHQQGRAHRFLGHLVQPSVAKPCRTSTKSLTVFRGGLPSSSASLSTKMKANGKSS